MFWSWNIENRDDKLNRDDEMKEKESWAGKEGCCQKDKSRYWVAAGRVNLATVRKK